MLKTLQIPSNPKTPLIKADQVIREKANATRLMDAGCQAREIVERAQRDAHGLRQAGFREGLKQGLDASLSPSLGLIARLGALKTQLLDQANVHFRSCLDQALNRPELVDAMMDPIVALAKRDDVNEVTIGIPVGITIDKAGLQASADATGLSVRFIDVELDGFHIDWHRHHFEVDRGAFDQEILPSEPTLALTGDEERHALCAALRLAAKDIEKGTPHQLHDLHELQYQISNKE